jgi:hypothetical protein
LVASGVPASAYSVLTHEAVIAWDRSILPLLIRRFPGATPDEVRKAHGFAYGGCIVRRSSHHD